MPSRRRKTSKRRQARPFRVIVVGAGVAGLAMSHCLHMAGIDHVVLERRKEVAPFMGASIAIWPHGCRLLDQMGVLDVMKKSCTPCDSCHVRGPDGKMIASTKLFENIGKNHGTDLLLLERRQFLQSLYDTLPDKSRVRLGCEVKTIIEKPDGVEVVLADGTIERGDIVVGADGVRSPVRNIMWANADKASPGLITAKEKACMKTRWKLLVGMTPTSKELGEAAMTVILDHKHSLMTLTQPNQAYFAAYFRLDEELSWPSTQRYTEADAEAAAASVASHPITEMLTFGDLWKQRQRHSLIGLEEGVLDHWYHGRIALVGDNVHKMTPNIGIGGNCALESVAVLCNQLYALTQKHRGSRPSTASLARAFQAYQEERRPRAVDTMTFARQITECQAWISPVHKFYTKWCLPLQSDHADADAMAEFVRRGPRLEYVDDAKFGSGGVGRVAWKPDDGFRLSGSWSAMMLQWLTDVTAVAEVALGTTRLDHLFAFLRL